MIEIQWRGPQPHAPLRISEALNHSEFVFEPKIAGFRASIKRTNVVISRSRDIFKSSPQLAYETAHALRADRMAARPW